MNRFHSPSRSFTAIASAALLALPLLAANSIANAQDFPAKPIRVLIGQAAGSATDVSMRAVGVSMQKLLGQPILVENRAGAYATLGAAVVIKSPADGYTLVYGYGVGFHPLLVKEGGIDAIKELAPVSLVMKTAGSVMVVRPDLPIKTAAELIAHTKNNPGKLNYGTVGAALSVFYQVLTLQGMRAAEIPYKSEPLRNNALLSGEADAAIGSINTLGPLIESGKVRALFTTTAQRGTQLPAVPSALEARQPLLLYEPSFGLYAPLGTPAAPVDKLSSTVAAAVKEPALQEQLAKIGFVTLGGPPSELQRIAEDELKQWQEIVKITGFKP